MFEPKSKPLAPSKVFYKRLFYYWLLSTGIILISLGLGTIGYMYFGDLNLTDGFYNASMILSGMGPDVPNPCNALKVFAAVYALFSGVIFITSISILFAPVAHRFFHIIHLEESEE